MRLSTGLFAGRESLVTHGQALSVIADNLANSNTPGYKNQRLEFGDLLAQSIGGLYSEPLESGNGVQGQRVSNSHRAQGTVEATGRPLDAAIGGNGFFVLNAGGVAPVSSYTRAGNFTTDAEGNLIAVSGENVMGFTAASPDTLVPLNVNSFAGAGTATTAISLSGNLDVQAPLVDGAAAAPATFEELNALSSFSAPVQITDSLGISHDVALHFFHTEQLGWTVQGYVDQSDLDPAAVPGTPVPFGDQATLTFDGTGAQPEAVTLNLNGQFEGAEATAVTVDLAGLTGFAAPSALTNIVADGNQAGTLRGVEIRDNGDLVAVLSSGTEEIIGQIALATFTGVDGLDRVGENQFLETELSGAADIGLAGTGSRGTLSGASLESSTVDPSREFVDLIRYQRGYQAGSQVISTMSELINTTIQIV